MKAPAGALTETKPFFRYSKGDPGQILFLTYCASCHSLDDTKLVGPSLKGLLGSNLKVKDLASGKTRNIEATTDYIRQSILEPNALLADGYPENLMPPIGAIFTETQIESLVNYIVKASKKP